MPDTRRILVTGGTSGIGLAAALRLAGPETRVVLNGRNRERGAAACRAVQGRGATAAFVAADVSDAGEAGRLVGEALPVLGGGIDVLVNAAGGDHAPTLFHQATPDWMDAVVRAWLLATMYCCHHALPHMPPGSAVVNVASDAAKVPTPGEAVIGAAMAGVAMFSRTLAMEAKRAGVRVNVATPSLVGGTRTTARITRPGTFSARLFAKAEAAAALGVPTADDVAALVEFLAGPGAARMTGQVVSVNGGISAG